MLIEKKENFLDEKEVKFPYNFGFKEIILFVKELESLLQKNGMIKDRKYLLTVTKNVFYPNDAIQSVIDLAKRGKYPQFGATPLKIDAISLLKVLCEIGLIINKSDKGNFSENSKDYLKFENSENFEKLAQIFIEKKESLFKQKKTVTDILKQQRFTSLKNMTIGSKSKINFNRSFDVSLLKKTTSDKKIPVKKELQNALSLKRKFKVVNQGALKKEDSLLTLKDVKNSPKTTNGEEEEIPEIEITLINDVHKDEDNVEVIHTSQQTDTDEFSNRSSYNESGSFKTSSLTSESKSIEDGSILHLDVNEINDKIYSFIQKKDFENLTKYIDQMDPKWRHPVEYKTFLHAAVISGSLQTVEILIKKGVDINECDKIQRTPLMYASSLGLREISVYLLGNGAKIHQKDSYGFSPLLLALKGHFFDLCSDLILFGADINMKRDNGMTALIEAIQASDLEMVNYILSLKNVKMNLKDQNGKSALLKSFESASLNIVIKILTNSGVDLTMIDEQGRGLFHYIAKNNRTDVLEYFLTCEIKELSKYSKMLLLQDYKKKVTPLHLAVHLLNSDLVKDMILLLDQLQLNYNIKDSENHTPYDIIFHYIEKEFMNLKSINPSLQGDKILEKIDRELLQIEEYLFPSSSFESK